MIDFVASMRKKRDCHSQSVVMKKEINLNFIKEMPLKKSSQKIEIAFKFTWKILYKLIGPRKKITRESPLNLIWFHFTGKSLFIFSTFSTISKKSNLEGVFEFFYSNPQLDQNLKPTRNLCGQFLYLYLRIHVFSV